MEKQERYHEWIKKKYEETRNELVGNRQDPMEHGSSLGWIRIGETRHLKDSIQKIRMDRKAVK